jgi:hypothetical protein
LRDNATKTKQKWMDEVAQADFRTDAGKSVAAFCREQEICASHFYWWKKRLRENTAARFVEVQVAESPATYLRTLTDEIRDRRGRDTGLEFLSYTPRASARRTMAITFRKMRFTQRSRYFSGRKPARRQKTNWLL